MEIGIRETANLRQTELAKIEMRIQFNLDSAYSNIVDVGRCLIEVKDKHLVPHGQWEQWLADKTGMSARQAQRWMQIAREVPEGSYLSRLEVSKIREILTLPEPEREAVAEQAAREELTLRELREQVQVARQQANAAQQRHAAEVEKLQAELEKAKAAPADGISREAQAEIDRLHAELDETCAHAGEEIDRLKDELADAQAYAERQAEQRQRAQREMLAMQSQAARGEIDSAGALGGLDVAAAVRAFIGAAGVLPHMGSTLARASAAERQEIREYVEMVATWVNGALQALSTVAGTMDEWGREA